MPALHTPLLTSESRTEAEMARSYRHIRQAIGYLALAFPFLLLVGQPLLSLLGWEPDCAIKATISDYYHSHHLRDIFVGVLLLLGAFLIAYIGPEKNISWRHNDDLWSTLAGLAVIGVALVPTTEYNAPITLGGQIHLAFASTFFLILAYFCFCLFTRSAPGQPMTPGKKKRNTVYKACGWIIVVSIGLIALYHVPKIGLGLERFKPIFWLESACVWAFSFSWLVKGEAWLQDQ